MAAYKFTPQQYREMAAELNSRGHKETAEVLNLTARSAEAELKREDDVQKLAIQMRRVWRNDPLAATADKDWMRLAHWVLNNYEPA